MLLNLKLPIPPSINHCYISKVLNGKVVKFKAKKFLDYIKVVLVEKPVDFKPISNNVYLTIDVFFRGRISDLDNILKVLFDSLQASNIIVNDSQIKKLSIEVKGKVSKQDQPYIIVKIFDLSN